MLEKVDSWIQLIKWYPVLPVTDRLKELNKLLEDVAKIAVSTGPRGAVRFAQGIEAFVTVGGEYLFQLLTVSHFLLNAYRNADDKALTEPPSKCGWSIPLRRSFCYKSSLSTRRPYDYRCKSLLCGAGLVKFY